MVDLFSNAFDALSGEEWDERPVGVEEFVTGEEYLNTVPLSEYQYQMIRAGSQIYKKTTLINLYGTLAGERRFEQTCTECIFALGKGSGKDFISTLICAYVIYLLLCLKNPQKYYGKPEDNAIDILNVATNSDQAKNVFFKNFKTIIKNSPWFDGRYEAATQNTMTFDKSISMYSGHSEREAFEGLNLFMAVLDEISAFADTETQTPGDTYNTYRDSVDSRFPEFGKVLLLSFPRKKTGDFILDKYNEVIVEKDVHTRTETLKLDPELPDGFEGNEFDVSWDEDHIIRYKYPGIFALKRPSWEVNPTKTIGMYTRNFHSNMANALAKFACMPTDGGENALFRNPDALDAVFSRANMVDHQGTFLESEVNPDPEKSYYISVDLSKVQDYTAVAMAHVDSWINIQVGAMTEVSPVVKVDLVRWWEPSQEQQMNYKDVTDFIVSLRRKGFNIKGCTLDRWQSHDTINFLNDVGIPTSMFSVKDEHYHTFTTLVYDQRITGPKEEELLKEFKELGYVKGKIDHKRTGHKDLCDATVGAVTNAIIHTYRPVDRVVETVTYADMVRRNNAERAQQQVADGVIRAPKREMPDDLADYLFKVKML